MEGYNLKKFLASPVSKKALPYLLLIFSVLGLLDAAYLSIQHIFNTIPPCTIGGCETVLTSSFSIVLGIPLPFLGAGFYVVILILTGLFLQTKNKRLTTIIFTLCTLGLLTGIFLIYVQGFILHAWCYYCLFSELIDFLLFDTAWWLWNSLRES